MLPRKYADRKSNSFQAISLFLLVVRWLEPRIPAVFKFRGENVISPFIRLTTYEIQEKEMSLACTPLPTVVFVGSA